METKSDTPRWDAIRLDSRDTVATVLRALAAGTRPMAAGTEGLPTLKDDVPRGHKFALADIKAGETIFKYGAPIGLATQDIAAGAHVHLHNLEGFAGREERQVKNA